MNYAATVPAVPADFFDERGHLNEYRPPPMQQQIGSMNILRQIPTPSNATYISENGVEIQYNISTSVSDPVPDPVPSPDFPFQEFPFMEVVNQSQIDSSSIPDMLHLGETSNSLKKASRSTDFPLKSMQNSASDEEMSGFRDLTISAKHTQSSRDPSTISISENSTPRKSISGTRDGIPSALPVDPKTQSSNNRSVMPTDVQALTILQDLVSDDFQAKNTHST